jgi:hypothetical protein
MFYSGRTMPSKVQEQKQQSINTIKNSSFQKDNQMLNINKFQNVLRTFTGACLLHGAIGATAAPALESLSDLEQHLQDLPKTIEFKTHSPGCLVNQADYSDRNGYWYHFDNAMASYSCELISEQDKQYHLVPVYSADSAYSTQPYYQIISAKNGLCLDMHRITGNAYFDPCHGGDNQLFSLVDSRVVVKENGKCLDIHLQNKNAYFHRCHGGDNQRFNLNIVPNEMFLNEAYWNEHIKRSVSSNRGRHLGGHSFSEYLKVFNAHYYWSIASLALLTPASIIVISAREALNNACKGSDRGQFELILQGKEGNLRALTKFMNIGLSEDQSRKVSKWFFSDDGNGLCGGSGQTSREEFHASVPLIQCNDSKDNARCYMQDDHQQETIFVMYRISPEQIDQRDGTKGSQYPEYELTLPGLGSRQVVYDKEKPLYDWARLIFDGNREQKYEAWRALSSSIPLSYGALLSDVVNKGVFPIDNGDVTLEKLSFYSKIGIGDLFGSNQFKTVYTQAFAMRDLINDLLEDQYPEVLSTASHYDEADADNHVLDEINRDYSGVKEYFEEIATVLSKHRKNMFTKAENGLSMESYMLGNTGQLMDKLTQCLADHLLSDNDQVYSQCIVNGVIELNPGIEPVDVEDVKRGYDTAQKLKQCFDDPARSKTRQSIENCIRSETSGELTHDLVKFIHKSADFIEIKQQQYTNLISETLTDTCQMGEVKDNSVGLVKSVLDLMISRAYAEGGDADNEEIEDLCQRIDALQMVLRLLAVLEDKDKLNEPYKQQLLNSLKQIFVESDLENNTLETLIAAITERKPKQLAETINQQQVAEVEAIIEQINNVIFSIVSAIQRHIDVEKREEKSHLADTIRKKLSEHSTHFRARGWSKEFCGSKIAHRCSLFFLIDGVDEGATFALSDKNLKVTWALTAVVIFQALVEAADNRALGGFAPMAVAVGLLAYAQREAATGGNFATAASAYIFAAIAFAGPEMIDTLRNIAGLCRGNACNRDNFYPQRVYRVLSEFMFAGTYSILSAAYAHSLYFYCQNPSAMASELQKKLDSSRIDWYSYISFAVFPVNLIKQCGSVGYGWEAQDEFNDALSGVGSLDDIETSLEVLYGEEGSIEQLQISFIKSMLRSTEGQIQSNQNTFNLNLEDHNQIDTSDYSLLDEQGDSVTSFEYGQKYSLRKNRCKRVMEFLQFMQPIVKAFNWVSGNKCRDVKTKIKGPADDTSYVGEDALYRLWAQMVDSNNISMTNDAEEHNWTVDDLVRSGIDYRYDNSDFTLITADTARDAYRNSGFADGEGFHLSSVLSRTIARLQQSDQRLNNRQLYIQLNTGTSSDSVLNHWVLVRLSFDNQGQLQESRIYDSLADRRDNRRARLQEYLQGMNNIEGINFSNIQLQAGEGADQADGSNNCGLHMIAELIRSITGGVPDDIYQPREGLNDVPVDRMNEVLGLLREMCHADHETNGDNQNNEGQQTERDDQNTGRPSCRHLLSSDHL